MNLKFIWDVVWRIKIGEKGKAYVVDDNGFLVADPDIGAVLRKLNLSHLAHVKAAIGKQSQNEPATVSTDLAGTSVLTSMAPIESLNWYVFVEQPVSEVFAQLYASIVRTSRPSIDTYDLLDRGLDLRAAWRQSGRRIPTGAETTP